MTTSNSPIIVWFRRDLRLADNPALSAALATGRPVIPLFIWAPEEEAPWTPGAASRWWLHHALVALDASLRQAGASLIVRRGSSLGNPARGPARDRGHRGVLEPPVDPALIARDTRIKAALSAQTFNASLLHEPWTIRPRQEKPYQVFTPFYKASRSTAIPADPAPPPKKFQRLEKCLPTISNDWNFCRA